MGYGNWCHCCYNLVCAVIDGDDLDKCNGCKQNSNDHLPPSNFKAANIYGGFNKKEEKSMIVTIIGSLTKKERNG